MKRDRRQFLGLLGAAGASVFLGTWSNDARGQASSGGRVRSIEKTESGTTVTLDLAHAPFPHGGSPYQDRTVIAFIPDSFRVEAAGRVPMLVHFHGHNTTAERAIVSHALREQLVDSRQNAILIVPQGPVLAADSSAGKLDAPGGLARMLAEALEVLGSREAKHAIYSRRALTSAPAADGPKDSRRLTIGTVCLSAHSGGYHAAASCLRHGGVDVNEVYLFDALYGELDVFRDWVIKGRGQPARQRHKLVSYYGPGATETNSQWLRAELDKSNVKVTYENVEGTMSREDLVRSEAVFVRTQLSHNGVTHELNALRDCLYGSGLPRHLKTAWFDAKTGARPLERRR